MAAKKNSVSKPATNQRVSADRQTALGEAALARLGNYLSARGTGGSADAMVGRSAGRTRQFMVDVATARGGGQGKSSPSMPARKSSPFMIRNSGQTKPTSSGGRITGVASKPTSSAKKPSSPVKKPTGVANKPSSFKKKK